MTGPSASGSENGMPTSSTSAPARSSAYRISAERERSGSPAVTYVTKPVRFSSRIRSNVAAILDANFGPFLIVKIARHALHVFVSAARQVHQHLFAFAELLRKRARICHGVRRLERRNNALEPRQRLERRERLVVSNPCVL